MSPSAERERSEQLADAPEGAGPGHAAALQHELYTTSRELHGLHREVEALRDRLLHERAEREELITVLSHELRTPVTVILGYSRLLLSSRVGELNADQRRFLEETRKSCERLDAFLDKLVAASHEPAGGDVLEVSGALLEPVISDVASAMGPLLDERRLRILLAVDADANRARFDRTRVEQILTNLLGNAIRYSPREGTIEVATRSLRRDGRRFVEVSVCDEGPGVPAADRERVFEPYVQTGESRRGGLGLGLAICRRLAEAHGGAIGVEPAPSGGARFAFTLPTEVA